jgi:hypothetical protein
MVLNAQVTGSIPKCYVESSDLQELYLSDNQLSGSLPSIPRHSPLTVLAAANQVPSCISAAAHAVLSTSKIDRIDLD